MIGSLSLDQLRVLVAIADMGSFSAAGRGLRRAQSAISQAVAGLEAAQGVQLFDRGGHRPQLTEVGRLLVDQARMVLASAARFEAVAANTRSGLEPELALAIDPLVPSAPLIDSLRALREAFPDLPVSFSTEGLGGAERKLRLGAAALAVCLLLPVPPDDLAILALPGMTLLPVVAPFHPLAMLGRPATRWDLEPHVQLVLSDPVNPAGPSYGLASARLWRFVDLQRRLDMLLAGFGWCRMPEHMVARPLAEGKLVRLDILDELEAGELVIYAARMRDRPLGLAGQWFLNDLRERLVDGPSAP